MLTLEPPNFTIRGLKIFRDYSDPRQFYYLPSERARVSENGKGLAFVVYTEDITGIPDFTLSEDRAGGFLTLEVELGPTPAEVEQVKSELASQAGVGDVILTQVPFTNGAVRLFILGQGGGAAGTPSGFDVSVAGSTKPSLAGRQTAVFSVRLGGKAANTLWETLRRSADPQAVVAYDLEYLAIQPSYNLEVVIDFKETFSYLRHRIGLNLLVAAADLDIMTQEMLNEGHITIREVDFSGKGNAGSPIAGEGGVLKLVRDLMSPTLFTTVPIPTPDYRALPDSATKALETGGGTKAFLSTGAPSSGPRTPTTVGTDLKITHTLVANGQTPGGAVEISADLEPASGVTVKEVKVAWRKQGTEPFQEVVLEPKASPATPTNPTNPTAPTNPPNPTNPTTPTEPVGEVAPAGDAGDTPAPVPAPTPAPAGASSFVGKIPGQPAGTTIEYVIRAAATKAGASITQTLPAEGDAKPLAFTVGAASTGTGPSLKVPETDGPLVGYSLRSIDVTQQIKRTFKLNRAEATPLRYHPSGALSANDIGPAFDPTTQITRVALGQGPFKVIVIKVQAGFDFDKHHVTAAAVHIAYGQNPDGPGPLHALTVPLTKEQPRGQVQFFADDRGTQDYSYTVEFTYDPDRVVGTVPGTALRSPIFTGQTSRSITVDLDLHSPLIPVSIEPGVLSFANELVKQVQVRVAPSPTTEGRVIQLAKDRPGDSVLVVPLDAAARTYHMQQKFFFRDGATTIENPAMTDTKVLVNEPNDLVFKMIPELADNSGLVKQVLVDAVYTHGNGDQERATLHLSGQEPRSEFAVLLRPGDPREWDASLRFVMHSGEPLESVSQRVRISEPLVTLKKGGFKVLTVALLDETIFATGDLLGIKVILGQDVNSPALPVASLLLKANRPSGSLVVPGVPPDAPVSVAIEMLRRNQPVQRTVSMVGVSERELFVTT
jgi:hypothetical protein